MTTLLTHTRPIQRFAFTMLLALLLGIGLSTSTVYGQERDGAFYLGLNGGVTQSNFYGDDADNADFRPGFTAGGSLIYNINSALAVQPEVSYTRRGTKNFGLDRMRLRTDYLEIPVLLKLSAPLKPVTPRAFVGPYVSFLLDDNMPTSEFDTRSVDLGGIVGGELGIDLSQYSGRLDEIAIDGRYGIGFLKVDDLSDGDLFNNGFSGSLSLRFRI